MIPIFNLSRQYKRIKNELNSAFTQTSAIGQFTLGQHVLRFEQEFAKYIGVTHGVGLASGTDALTLGLTALGVGKGDEVILPANSYPSAFGVAESGATIKLVDVKDDGTMDPRRLATAITRHTRAVVPVHLYGTPADLGSINRVLRGKNIFLIEDAAQAHGTRIGSKYAGAIGDIAVFSFYPSKNLGALGDGGMVVTRNKKIADHLKQLRMYGETGRYRSVEISGVSRLDELHAALLRVKLKHLYSWVQRRRYIANLYTAGLQGIGDLRIVTASPLSSFHLFVIRTGKRDQLQTYLMNRGICTAIHYPTPIHLVPSFKSLGYKKGDFPVSEALSKEILSIPLFPELTDIEVNKVIRTIQHFYKKRI
jgi:dTDP-4-amino-4,6-dideoxygalactose transaminase